MMKRLTLIVCFGWLCVACQQSEQPAATEDPVVPEQNEPPPATPPESEPGAEVLPEAANLGAGHPVALSPPAPFKEPPLRARRRMDIDQLNNAIQRVSGGIAWTLGNNNANQFEVLAGTLGKPNFIDQTREDLDPSALFQKFLDDAARSVCNKLAQNETAVPASERVLMVHVSPTDTWESNPAGVGDNLVELLLRYHGRKLASDAPELEQWKWLFRSAVMVSGSPVTAWRTVCVGLISHPYFYTY